MSGSQSLAGNVPAVQGIPQASSVPLVQGTPSPLSNPLSNPTISQGAALSSPTHVSPPHEPVHHPGPPPVHHPVHPPIHHPEPPPVHHPGYPPIHHPEPPPVHHHSGEPFTEHLHHQHPTHQHLGQVSTHQTSTIARRAVTGGTRVAGGLSRRAVLTLLVGGAATVAVGSVAAVVVLASSSPDKPVLAYCNAIKNGDAQTAYSQLSSRLQSQTNEQQFASQVQQIASLKPISDCSTSNVQQNASTATLTLKVTLFGISFFPLTFNVKVIKENGVWKVDDGTLLSL
jgi:hypothetical protein